MEIRRIMRKFVECAKVELFTDVEGTGVDVLYLGAVSLALFLAICLQFIHNMDNKIIFGFGAVGFFAFFWFIYWFVCPTIVVLFRLFVSLASKGLKALQR